MAGRKLVAFTETVIFTEDLLEVTDDEPLYAIQNALLANPLLGDVIKGTGGARKGCIGNPKARSGKSGGFRSSMFVCLKMTDFTFWQFTAKKIKAIYLPRKPRSWVRSLKQLRSYTVRNNEMDKKQFARLLESAEQAKEHAEGKRELRTTTLPPPPLSMDKTEVVKIRESLNFSQAVFAKYLNVSVKTVQAWEQGIGKPTGASLKLLSIIRRKPSLLIELST